MKDNPTQEARHDQTGTPGPAPEDAAHDQSPGIVSDTGTGAPQAAEAQDAQGIDSVNINGLSIPRKYVIPESPDFDISIYNAYAKSLDDSGVEAEKARLREQLRSWASKAATAGQSSAISTAAALYALNSAIVEISESGKTHRDTVYKTLHDAFQFVDLPEWADHFPQLQKDYEERIAPLMPHLEAEAAELNKTPGFEWATAAELLKYINLDGTLRDVAPDSPPVPPEIANAISRATERRRAELPQAIAKRTEIVDYPLDKVNSTVWNLLQDTPSRQNKLWLKAERDGSEKQLSIIYSIDFDDLEDAGVKITKRLTSFDKRVYVAIAALYNAGNKVISLTQIHYAMGGTGRPATEHLQSINTSITKMRKANVFLDNIEESEHYKYPRFKEGTGIFHEFFLLPVDRITAVINGQIVDAAIQILKEPPLMTFARQRKQITTITVKVLQSPISKTEANLLIDDYLIERIAKAKRNSKGVKILYNTLYEAARIKTYKQKARAPEKVKKYLDHYKSCGLISGYQMLDDGIQIEF